jgi:hypothetical protein
MLTLLASTRKRHVTGKMTRKARCCDGLDV